MSPSAHNMGTSALFGFGGGPDLKNSSMVIANSGQGGLSLPNREYYTKTDEKSVETRAKFVEYMTNMFKLLGDSPEKAAANAKTVMDIQMRLANVSLPPVELRNPDNRYQKISLAEANKLAPNLYWETYMTTRGVPAVTETQYRSAEIFHGSQQNARRSFDCRLENLSALDDHKFSRADFIKSVRTGKF